MFPEPWHIQNQKYIQNPGIFRTLTYSKSEAYSESVKHLQENCNYFCNISLFVVFSTIWNKYHELVTSEAFVLCQKLWCARGPGTVNFFVYLLIYWNKLAYLQLITVMAYGNSLPKSHEQDYIKFQKNPWEILVNLFSFRTCNLTKTELFLRYFSKKIL